MRFAIPKVRALVAGAAIAVGASGCGQLAPIGEVLGGVISPAGPTDALEGEVRFVDDRQRHIGLRTPEGQTGTIPYDDRTRVVFQQKEYPVSALEPGDLVEVELAAGPGGAALAGMVYVQRNVREGRPTGEPASERLYGTVGEVDRERGRFAMRPQFGGTVVVALPYNPADASVHRFESLRDGQAVQVEVHRISDTRYELRRFL